MDWSAFNKFDKVNDTYLPARGQGDSLATQIVTAVNKIIYKWYNDGDVYDNTGALEGWANDLSSYANWLYKYCPIPHFGSTLEEIFDCYNGDEYENLLYRIAEDTLDPDLLDAISSEPKQGDIYNCDGPFRFVEYDEDDGEYDEEEMWEDEDYEDEEY